MQGDVNQLQSVFLVLTPAEALVLFALLSGWDKSGAATIRLEHEAEYRVLWAMLGMLENTLTAPFMPDYEHLLNRARELVQDAQE